jgi:hypothetical protein
MTTKNNWISSNICDRLSDPSRNFKVDIKFRTPNYINFDRAVKETAEDIAALGKKIYIGYSGGLDSEFVVTKFLELHIPFTPITLDTVGNNQEVVYAKRFYQNHGLNHVLLNISEKEMVEVFYKNIFTKLNGRGQNSTSNIIIGNYVKSQGGLFLMAEHLLGDVFIEANEWDYYNEAIVGAGNTLHFFNYTPEICYSLIDRLDFTKPNQKRKTELYGIENRPKYDYCNYSDQYRKLMKMIMKTRKLTPSYNHCLGTPKKFLDRFRINED